MLGFLSHSALPREARMLPSRHRGPLSPEGYCLGSPPPRVPSKRGCSLVQNYFKRSGLEGRKERQIQLPSGGLTAWIIQGQALPHFILSSYCVQAHPESRG